MCKVASDLKNGLNLSEQTMDDLKARYHVLMKELKTAREAFQFERTSSVKMEMVYIIEELKNRKVKKEEQS
ncbi:hypothetical protein [Halalkalibacter alkaliphilus]|uniref:Uncharacterized protein n=1 Tax=Halalkalibacter alkaliphilus TaxID=2917993 RepID=A0A9X2A2H7_9BACI|nr:hypothetical protein [Halalkalibacter alkaliphilus]MCL7746720.1 hypothetical protein [Halalkalibacter alkaliphilus]